MKKGYVLKRLAALTGTVILLMTCGTALASGDDVKSAYETTASVQLGASSVLSPGTTGAGEWVILGLERGGYDIPSADIESYLQKVKTYVNTKMNAAGRLDKNKSTENSRLIIALTSLGINAMDFDGIDLTAGLNELSYLKRQGINGPIWALIALDSHGYPVPAPPEGKDQLTRKDIIDYLLSCQLSDGGWALSGTKADPDITAMLLQAIAKYTDVYPEVKEAVDEGLECLSLLQQDNGGYGSWGTVNSESTAQVITALCELGIDPDTDTRFIKNGNTLIDALMEYYADGQGFKHILSSSMDPMATEQAFYALTAYYRLKDGKTSLYDMKDVPISHEHVGSDWIIDKDPTYAEKGTKHTECVICGEKMETGTIDELTCAHEHTRQINGKEPTCTEKGHKPDTYCDDCMRTIITGDDIPLKEHNFEDGECTECGEPDPDYDGDEPKPEGTTKSAYVTVNGVTYAVSPATKEAVELITALGDAPSDEAVLTAYRKYDALTPDEKLFVDNISSLEALTANIGERLHTDAASGARAEGNIPWYVRLDVTRADASPGEVKALAKDFGTEFITSECLEIGFTDLLTGEAWQPSEDISVEVGSAAGGKYVTAVFAKEPPTAVPAVRNGETVTFETQNTGRVIIAGHDVPLFGNEDGGKKLSPVWYAVLAAALILLAAAMIIKKKNRNNE